MHLSFTCLSYNMHASSPCREDQAHLQGRAFHHVNDRHACQGGKLTTSRQAYRNSPPHAVPHKNCGRGFRPGHLSAHQQRVLQAVAGTLSLLCTGGAWGYTRRVPSAQAAFGTLDPQSIYPEYRRAPGVMRGVMVSPSPSQECMEVESPQRA